MFQLQLKKIRDEHGLSQMALAKKLNVAQSTVGMWESGRSKPEYEKLMQLCKLFDVSLDQLTGSNTQSTATNSIFTIDNLIPIKIKKIPLLGNIACGQPILAEENLDGFVNCPAEIDADFALTCKGDSMINARIFNDDIVFIRQQDDIESGEIAAVLIENNATLKRVFKYPDKLVLRAENPTCPDIILSEYDTDSAKIIGKAVYFLSVVK